MCEKKDYSVRCWDAFWQNWVMIPVTNLTRQEAIDKAIELSQCYDCGEDGTQEMQVYVECVGGMTSQMIGYVEYAFTGDSIDGEIYDWVFVESFS